MVFKYSDIRSYEAHATDDVVGGIKDILFDDTSGQIRYFVVDTARWLPGHKVLLAPLCMSLENPWLKTLLIAVSASTQ